MELVTKSPEQYSECSALNHYGQTAVNTWICQSNASMTTSLCNITKGSMWTYPKMKDSSLLHVLLNPNLLPVTCHMLVHFLWDSKSKAYNKGDVAWFFEIIIILLGFFHTWMSSHSFKKVKKICKVKIAMSLQKN